ncbi:hypothetical protein J2Z42_001233 [Clostridium algifaecis]|uniref:Uncharacterized protein n=1 Tax=Clostridium algifaecis TaxID=1472040 RepID=A0ABS4KSX0_9CLOT|nr:hypothetical protein [Clostridium algifaecis]MBP2032561.1 hypothetical protein [Clostridium algifaecis]
MNNCIDVLSLSNKINKNKVSNSINNIKKLDGGSFGSIFNKAKINLANTSNSSSIEEVNESLKEDIDKKADAAVERLAGFFGIGKHLMAAILQSLNIDPKDLLDPSQKKNIVDTLSKKFGLNKYKSDALSNLMSDF